MSLLASSAWRLQFCAAVFTLLGVALPSVARAADADTAAEPPSRPSREQIQQLHEKCQRQIDDGEAEEAARCLLQVYEGLVALDATVTVDLYYVLSDAIASLDAAARTDPRELCRADRLLQDYRKRTRRFAARRYDGKVGALHTKILAELQSARGAAGRDVCVEEPPTSVEAPDPGESPLAGAVVEPVVEPPTEVTPGEPKPTPGPATTDGVRPPRTSAPVRRTTPRRQLFQPRLPYTALLDASFGVTLAGVVGAGVGAALYIYGIECKDDLMRCDKLAPTGVRDAGLVLMSAGAATMIVGFGLRFADHRAARKALLNVPRPAVSPTALGLSWAATF